MYHVVQHYVPKVHLGLTLQNISIWWTTKGAKDVVVSDDRRAGVGGGRDAAGQSDLIVAKMLSGDRV